MTKPYRHVGVLFMLAITVLALLGSAFTLWYEDLSIETEASTGSFDADWVVGTNTKKVWPTAASPFTPAYSDFVTDPGTTLTGVDCSSTNVADDAPNTTTTSEALTLTMTGMYPFSACEFNVGFRVDSQSNTPAQFMLTAASPNSYLKVFTDSSAEYCAQLVGALNGTLSLATPVAVRNAGNTGSLQLNPSDSAVDCNLLIYLVEEGDSGTVVEASTTPYTISVTIKAHQWNEQP